MTAEACGAGVWRPAAVLFDMDGLLLDTERVARDSFLEAVVPYGMTAAEADPFFRTLVGSSNAVTRDRLRRALPGIDMAAFDRDWLAALDRRLATGVPVKPRVAEVLAALAAQGHRMAVVTSSMTARAKHHLDHAGVLHYFTRVAGGDAVSRTKPDPAPYVETAQALGVDPTDCAAFEDSDLGVQAAVAAGCRVVQVPDLRPEGQPLPELGQAQAPDLYHAARLLGLF